VKKSQSKPKSTSIERTEWLRRLDGLSAGARRLAETAAAAIDRRQLADARRALVGAAALAPRHVEILRLQGVLEHLEGHYRDAVQTLRSALASSGDDALVLNNLGSALRADGQLDEALMAFRRATEIAPGLGAAWFNLGKTLKSHAAIADAEVALERAVEIMPGHVGARIVLGDIRKALGDIVGAAACYRRAAVLNPYSGQAWFSLANLKTVRFTDAEVASLSAAQHKTGLAEADRVALGFAWVKALEDAGQHEAAFRQLLAVNAAKRRQLDWDAGSFSAHVDALIREFPSARVAPCDDGTGREVIFVVSMPRSGSTLIEQILAAHPDVEGASELPDLPAVLDEESRRRARPFPAWASEAHARDWERLGARYLERTRRWTVRHPRFTDKGLANWQLVGAALDMLPGARVVVCRRDPVETCLSCFHQLFARGQEYSYSLDDLAAYWRDFDRLCRHWLQTRPGRIHELHYENLLSDPERVTRDLLGFCGLRFDEACLRFHESDRAVRTASAAQVREPLRRDTARAERYGAALDPLRQLLSGH
jgi:tetratricopeptide (TPR) repeat protein